MYCFCVQLLKIFNYYVMFILSLIKVYKCFGKVDSVLLVRPPWKQIEENNTNMQSIFCTSNAVDTAVKATITRHAGLSKLWISPQAETMCMRL